MQGFPIPEVNYPASEEPVMYRKNDGQTTTYDFILPFGGHLKEDNRRVKLHHMIDWERATVPSAENMASGCPVRSFYVPERTTQQISVRNCRRSGNATQSNVRLETQNVNSDYH